MDTTKMSSAQQRRRIREKVGVDPMCEELAKHFLSDVAGSTPDDISELARAVQVRVESFIADKETPLTAVQQSIRDGTFGVQSSDAD